MVKVSWLLLMCTYNYIVLALSFLALYYTTVFVSQVELISLPFAPKATGDLKKVFLPPMKNMQLFVFMFDISVALYYVY